MTRPASRLALWSAVASCLLLVCLFLPAVAAAKETKPVRLDDGLIDPAWFGPDVQFRKTEDIDYLWVREGFTFKGRKLLIAPWSEPQLMGDKRDAKDGAKAAELTELMPSRLKGALTATMSGYAEVSKEDGDLVLTGRFVDCNAGSKVAKWLVGMGAGSAFATWDMKITDKATGELLVALHHRSISGTNLSEIEDKIAKWLQEFATDARADFAIFAKGKPAKK